MSAIVKQAWKSWKGPDPSSEGLPGDRVYSISVGSH